METWEDNKYIRLFDLLKNPRNISNDDLINIIQLFHITPEKLASNRTFTYIHSPIEIFSQITGMSKGEGKRRNISISKFYDIESCNVKFGVLKIGKNDFEPFFIVDNREEDIVITLNYNYINKEFIFY